MKYITILGNFGETFSAEAWQNLVQLFNAPSGEESNCIPAVVNGEILQKVMSHGGYGAIAIESKCDGVVAESIDSFSQLLVLYPTPDYCPFHIIGAVKLRLNFCLMAHHSISTHLLTGIIAHPVALKACRNRINDLQLKKVEATSNGAAARKIVLEPEFLTYGALGPHSAALKLNLKILEENVESDPAFTTFALVGPKTHTVIPGEQNQAVIVFNISNISAALVGVLKLFSEHQLNLSYIRSVHVKDDEVNFIISLRISRREIELFNRAVAMLPNRTRSHLVFGPFPVFER